VDAGVRDFSPRGPALDWLENEVGIPQSAAQQIIEYLALTKIALGAMPTQEQIVVERFFDENGSTHVVIHAPFGSRLNRAWGLALRKRFCRSFNFELQPRPLKTQLSCRSVRRTASLGNDLRISEIQKASATFWFRRC
jgi:Lhr-like helicase